MKPKGPPPPFGIDPTACYDTKRDRIYIGGGSYPVAEGPERLWVYDVKTDTWIDPKPRAHCCGGSNSYNTNIAVMTYDQANDVVVLNLHTTGRKGRPAGSWVYDPEANAWDGQPRPFPEGLKWKAGERVLRPGAERPRLPLGRRQPAGGRGLGVPVKGGVTAGEPRCITLPRAGFRLLLSEVRGRG